MNKQTADLRLLLHHLGTDPQEGLSGEDAALNLEQYGENRLGQTKGKSLFQRFLGQMKDAMALILLAAAAISFGIALMDPKGSFLDSIIIVGIVLLNALLGMRQESKAEHALAALQELSAPSARVIREGEPRSIPAAQVVPGDIVLLEAGDFVPADGRLLESAGLRCEESALTGESVPAEKDASARVERDAPVGERSNMVFSGCAVSYGRGTAVVTATGLDTEMGRIARLIAQEPEEATPLQQRLGEMGKYLGFLALGICAVIFVVGLLQGIAPVEIFMIAVSLAVAAIPEGLTAVVTVVLALGVQRMVKQNAVIRHLPAVETLGSASVICSDKTGTLTQNKMTVRRIWAPGREPEDPLKGELSGEALQVLRLGSLCNDARISEEERMSRAVGDPTETAIVAAALESGLDKRELDEEFVRLAEIPFDSGRRLMTTVHRVGDQLVSVTKGGFDVLLPRCAGTDRARVEAVNREMAEDALRVLAVACRELEELPEEASPEALERELTFIGLIGMIDPPRPESREAVALARKAGIRTVMITGDHAETASAVARELGILREGDKAISGRELARLSDSALARAVDQFRVYARVSPEDKIRIVKAWQETGRVVAMTGDGVNDAPALKAADIGCAMGMTGTDVAKNAADMVLTDDNFTTIVEAVRGGRGIYDNIRKTVQFLLGSNLGEVIAVLFAMLLGWGAPLLAIHLLLVNVITDALPALALGVEPVDPDIMGRKPIPREQGIFSGGLGAVILLQGAMVGILTLIAYYIGCFVLVSPYAPPSHETGVTMAFLALVLTQLAQALNCRSGQSLLHIGFFSNRSMVYALLGSLAVVLLICLFPPLERLFHLVDLSMAHWILVLALSLLPLALAELGKWVVRLWKKRGS